MDKIEKEFIRFSVQVGKGYGMDTLTSKLFGYLYLEPGEMTMGQLAKKTGYSLASISNKLKILIAMGLATRIKKPGSKKVYFYMQKDVVELVRLYIDRVFEVEIEPVKKTLPKLLENLSKKELTSLEKTKYNIIENYYKQTLLVENIMKQAKKNLEELR